MRCFTAIDLPKSLKKRINNFQKEVKKKDIFYGKYVEEENLHLSLKFLGEINKEKVKRVKETLAEIDSSAFSASLKNIGAFPGKHFVKVLWIGAEQGRKQIINLHDKIDDKLSGLLKKSKRFEPHITLMRVKNISSKSEMKKFFEEYENKKFANLNIDSFSLFKSTLTEKGPIYEKISNFKLN